MEFHPRNATRKSTNVLNCSVEHKNAEGVVPPRVSHVVPEIRVGKTGIRPVPKIATPVRQVLCYFLFYRGAIPSFAMQNSPLKGAESNAEGEAPPRASHAVPEIRAGKTGKRPAPKIATPQCFAPACSRASIILSVTGSNRIS